jgi:hypothetical protein
MFRSNLGPLAASETDAWETFTRGLAQTFGQEGRSLDSLAPLLIGFALLLLVALGVGFLLAQYRRYSLHSPKRLFLGLCRAQRLSWKQTWLLWQLARAQGLENAALLFVDPDRFDPGYISLWLRPHQPALLEIRRRIFAGLSDKTVAAKGGVDVAAVLRESPDRPVRAWG